MRAMRSLPLALAAVAVLSIGPAALSDESGNPTTGPREPDGWKGIPGAKDPGEPGKSPGWAEVELKIVPVEKDFGFRTPRDSVRVGATQTGAWVDVTSGTLPLEGLKGGSLKFQPLNGRNMLDADGDGSYETPLEKELVAVRTKRPDGTDGVHYFRLRRDDKAYFLNRACMAVGKLEDGTPIAFIDENNNGLYGDPSADAMRLGGAPVAQYTSEVINVKNKLFYLRVNQSGTRAWTKPYDGPTGIVDLATGFKGKSKPLFVMIQQGEIIIDAAAKDTVVPTGTWSVFEGLVGTGVAQCAKIRAGRMNPIEVQKDKPVSVAWGMPGAIDFSVTKNGNQIVISTSSIRILGSAGEEYVDFRPKKFTPRVHAVDERSKQTVYDANMGAGC